jgi:hypothetical protein
MFKWKFKEVKSPIQDDMTLEQVRVDMVSLMAEENTNHYRMGQLYNHVVSKKLAEKAGYNNAQEYFSKVLSDLSYTALRMYGAVAAAFSEQISIRFGITCVYLLLTYKEAADLEVNHEEPGSTSIEVPDEKGVVTTQLFGACSVEQMRKAIQRKRKPSSSKPVPPEHLALADQYQEAMTSRFPKGVSVKVQVRNQKGQAVLDFKGVPVTDVGTLVAVLTAGLPPVSEVQRVETAPLVS